MMVLARAMKNSSGALRGSVQRRSLPKLFIQDFVRSTTLHPPSAGLDRGLRAALGDLTKDPSGLRVMVDHAIVVPGVQAQARVLGQRSQGRCRFGEVVEGGGQPWRPF